MNNDIQATLDMFLKTIKKLEQVVETGIKELDGTPDEGIRKGNVYLISGNSKRENTEFVLRICNGITNAYDDKNIFLCSLETNENKLRKTYKKRYDNDRFSNVLIDDSENISVSKIRTMLGKRSHKNVNIVIIDCLQHFIPNADDSQFSNHRYRYNFKQLKNIAKEFNIPVVITTNIKNYVNPKSGYTPSVTEMDYGYVINEYVDTVFPIPL